MELADPHPFERYDGVVMFIFVRFSLFSPESEPD